MFYRLPDWLRYEIQHRWERTAVNTRRRINTNPRLIISITAASVLVLVVTIGLLMPGEAVKVKEYDKGWFYDLNTGQLFVAKSDAVVPIEAPSGPLPQGGPAGVRAYVFSYSDEPNETNRFIGFLEIPHPEIKKKRVEPVESTAGGAERWGQGMLICRVGDEQWVPANGAKGRAILRGLFHPNRKGEIAHYCPPE